MTINEFIIHKIDKAPHRDPKVTLRRTAMRVTNARVVKFTEIAIEVFKANEGKPSSVFADFNADIANYPFSDWCLRYFSGDMSFPTFTKQSTNRLSVSMKQQHASTGGFVVFANITTDGNNKLFVLMLHPQDGLSISKNLEFKDVSHLELRHIDKAALITAPLNGAFGQKPVTYAGFRKAMSQYFQEFIGPDAFRNPAKDSADLIDRLDDYARENNIAEPQLDTVRAAIRTYARQCSQASAELDLAVISAHVNPADPGHFAVYATQQGISAFIKPDPNVFKRWRVIRHTSQDGLMLQFKAEMVGPPGTQHRLELDTAQRTITIKDVEDDLINKIESAKS